MQERARDEQHGHTEAPVQTGRDPLYLFACYSEWHFGTNVAAYKELVTALDDSDPDVQLVAESLLKLPAASRLRYRSRGRLE
jgi:hypothetical protein